MLIPPKSFAYTYAVEKVEIRELYKNKFKKIKIEVSSVEIAMEILRSARMENTDENISMTLEFPGSTNYDKGIVFMDYSNFPVTRFISVSKYINGESDEKRELQGPKSYFRVDSKDWNEEEINFDEICEFIRRESPIDEEILSCVKKNG